MPSPPDADSNLLIVVAAALIDRDGRVLLQQRPPGRPLAGLWEFPGGKVEQGETLEAALCRELVEELGVVALPVDLTPSAFASEPLDGRHLVLLLYLLRDWGGTIEARHATDLRWVLPTQMRELAMPPADLPLIDLLEKLL